MPLAASVIGNANGEADTQLIGKPFEATVTTDNGMAHPQYRGRRSQARNRCQRVSGKGFSPFQRIGRVRPSGEAAFPRYGG